MYNFMIFMIIWKLTNIQTLQNNIKHTVYDYVWSNQYYYFY